MKQTLVFVSLVIVTAVSAIAAVEIKNRGIIAPTAPPEATDPNVSLESIINATEPGTNLQGSIGTDDTKERKIIQTLANDLEIDQNQLTVEIRRIIGDYYSGSVYFSNQDQPSVFYAAEIDGNMHVILISSEHPACAEIEPYAFPSRMIPVCLADESNEQVRRD